VLASWLTSISQQAAALEQPQANNFARWPILGIEVWPNSEAAGSYDAEVAYFINWLNLRFDYLDSLFNTKATTTTALTSANLPAGGIGLQAVYGGDANNAPSSSAASTVTVTP
jgi:hypothetical protein